MVTIGRAKSAAAEATTRVFIPNTVGVDVVALFKVYVLGQHPRHGRFWRHWRWEKWTSLPVGHNPLSETPRRIAEWLGKENLDTFTGHCFRRSSATAYANATGDKVGLKRLGGWRSDSVVERYIAESEHEKKKQALALGPEDERPQAIVPEHIQEPESGKEPDPAPEPKTYTFSFKKCANITLNFL